MLTLVGVIGTWAAVILASLALWYARRAGQDLTHDRRDTFELQVLRELYEGITNGVQGNLRILLDYLGGYYPRTVECLDQWPNYMWEAMHSPTHKPENFADLEAYQQWRGQEMTRLTAEAQRELLAAIRRRTGSKHEREPR